MSVVVGVCPDEQASARRTATFAAAGLVVFQHVEKELCRRLVEAARSRLAELEYGIEKSKMDSMDRDEDF